MCVYIFGVRTATVDQKGRLMLANHFMNPLYGEYGPDETFYMTSFRDGSLHVFPMSEWIEMVQTPAGRILDGVQAFAGEPVNTDGQRRLTIPSRIRDELNIQVGTRLEVKWDRTHFVFTCQQSA